MATRRGASWKLLVALGAFLVAQSAAAAPINWRHNLDAAKIEASRTGKLVLLHFYTASCGPCKKLESDVFSQPQIAAAMEKEFVPVKLDADLNPAIANAYQIDRVPFEIVLNSQGNVVQKLTCPLEPNAYGSQLVNVATHYRGNSGVRTASAQSPINAAYAGLNIKQSAPQAAPQVAQAPTVPAVTTNPYVQSTPPAAQRQVSPPVAQQVPAHAPPAITPTPSTPTPDRYENRYAQAAPTTPAPAANVSQQPITPTPTKPALEVPVAKTPQPQTSPTMEVAPTMTAKPPVVAAAPAPANLWPPQLPEGTPPLAFDGYCPVSLREKQKWLRGDKTFGAIHRGRTYLFAGEEERAKFLASRQASDSYSPVFSGNDPVSLLDNRVEEPGQRKFGFQYRNAFYLFSTKENMEKFARQPDRYSERVLQAMTSMDANLGGTIRR